MWLRLDEVVGDADEFFDTLHAERNVLVLRGKECDPIEGGNQIGVNLEVKVADWPTTSNIGLKSDQGWNLWTHGFGIEPYEGPASAMSHWVKGQGQRKADPVIDSLFDKINAEMNVDAQKKIFVDFENQMNDQAIAVNMGNFGLFQVATSKLKNFKAYRIPRMWGVWLD